MYLLARPVLYPKAMDNTTMTSPMMKAFIPAPGGAFESSPSARTTTARMVVPTNSVKKAVAGSTQLLRGEVMNAEAVPLSARLWVSA